MAYSTISEVREFIPDVTSSIVADAVITKFISYADAKIDDVLRDTYDVPLDPVPASITQLSAKMVAYEVVQLFPDVNSSEDLERLERFVMDTLMKYGMGELKLDDSYLSSEGQDNVDYFYDSVLDNRYDRTTLLDDYTES